MLLQDVYLKFLSGREMLVIWLLKVVILVASWTCCKHVFWNISRHSTSYTRGGQPFFVGQNLANTARMHAHVYFLCKDAECYHPPCSIFFQNKCSVYTSLWFTLNFSTSTQKFLKILTRQKIDKKYEMILWDWNWVCFIFEPTKQKVLIDNWSDIWSPRASPYHVFSEHTNPKEEILDIVHLESR